MASLKQVLRWLPERGPIRDYVLWASKTTHAPAHFHLASIIPTCAYVSAWNGYTWGDDWHTQQSFRVMTAIVSGSGVGKSTAISCANDFTEDVIRPIKARMSLPYLKASGSVQGLRHAMKEHFNFMTETTPVIFLNDEVTALLRQDDTAETLNKWFDGRSDEHHTVWMQREYGKAAAKEEGAVQNPATSGLFASTPIAMERWVRPDQLAGGLFSRILWCQGRLSPEELTLRQTPHLHERQGVATYWGHWLTYLSVLLPRDVDGTKAIVVTPDAFQMLEERLFTRYRADIANQHSTLSGIKMRLIEYAKQIGALYALNDPKASVWRQRIYVTPYIIEPAIRYIEEQCEYAVTYLEQVLSPNPTRRLATKIADLLYDRGQAGITRTELYKTFRATKGELQPALETLEDGGEAVLAVTHTGAAGGRPSQRIVHAKYMVPMEDGGGEDNAAAQGSRLTVIQGGLKQGGV